MTFKDAFDKSNDWKKKIVLVSLFHNRQRSKYARWTMMKTANYFEVSVGLVSENLKLNRRYDEVSDCKTRDEALRRVKNDK